MDRVSSNARRTTAGARTTRHVVTGDAAEVRAAVETLAGRGELVSIGYPRRVPDRPGHVRVELVTTARIPSGRTRQAIRARWLRPSRWGRPRPLVLAVAGTAAAVLAAVVWVVVSLVAWVAAHAALIVGAVVVAAIVAALIARTAGNGSGRGGCRCC